MVVDPTILSSKRIILWPKGNFTLGSYLPQNCLSSNLEDKDAISLALRFSWYFIFRYKKRWISWNEWKTTGLQKLKFTEEFCYYLFTVALGFNDKISMEKDSTDLLLLAYALAFQNSQTSEKTLRNSCNFVKLNLEKLLILALIFDPAIQNDFICCSQLDELPKIDLINANMLKLCDHFLEGTVIGKDEKTKVITPFRFSDIALKYWTDDNLEIKFTKLLTNISNFLQSDMYALDEFEIKAVSLVFNIFNPPKDLQKKISISTGSTRSITSTILPQHRKLSVRNWSHMEILNNTVYRNINLRISDGNYLSKSSFIFHLTTLKSTVISDCSDISPIVLGPVTDFVILRNLHNCRISVITKRILIIDCDNLMIFLNCETRPVIVGASMNICFAPYNVWFNALEMELNQANLNLHGNNYSNPIYVASIYKYLSSADINDEIKVEERFQILPENDFYLQPTPLPSSLPYSKTFVENLGNYLPAFLERRKSAENYLKKLTMPEIELLTPLSTDDLHYLKKKISSNVL